ncbi:unnamed protein product [Soboliphyme baturini]|uniref:Uncharacterized protein n=1 Tax=Soboliphyme baturini TaxID=241478 RepID=A0A183J4V8_9BILA|nr:unnamed protein product [Soboliphyme baturini]
MVKMVSDEDEQRSEYIPCCVLAVRRRAQLLADSSQVLVDQRQWPTLSKPQPTQAGNICDLRLIKAPCCRLMLLISADQTAGCVFNVKRVVVEAIKFT